MLQRCTRIGYDFHDGYMYLFTVAEVHGLATSLRAQFPLASPLTRARDAAPA
jgi:hypothetical protein